MHTTESSERSERELVRDRAQRRAIENIVLSEHTAGARVTEIVRHRLANGTERVVITHPDRQLPRELIDHAFEALRYSGLVCAPDGDGDIALIGMTEPHDGLLAAIQWGTSAALDSMLIAARAQHVSVLLLPPAGEQQDESSR